MKWTMAVVYSASTLLNIGRKLGKPKISEQIHRRLKQWDLVKPFRGIRSGRNSGLGYVNRTSGVSPQRCSNVNNLINICLSGSSKSQHTSNSLFRIQPVVSARCDSPTLQQNGCNPANLCKIPPTNIPKLKAAVLNARSVCNKALSLCEYVKDNNIDVFGITETWLKPADQSVIAELTPPGYTTLHIPRSSGRGGGVAIIHRDSIQVKASSSHPYRSFEYIERKIITKSTSFLFVVLYRPPPSAKNSLTVPIFMEEFGSYLESVLISNSKLVLCGDFNFHMDSPSHPDTKEFLDLIDSAGLHQYVTTPTHTSGHILDIVLTRISESLASVEVHDELLSDHCSVSFEMDLAKPPLPKKEVQYRKVKSIDLKKFRSDIIESGLPGFHHDDVDKLVDMYNSTLSEILEKHAPIKKRMVTIHPDAPWIDDEIKQKKREKRKAERNWRRTGLTVHKEIYIDERKHLNILISRSKREFYQQQISTSSCKQSTLFKCVDDLLNKKKVTSLPSHESTKELCDRMSDFFADKIRVIHEGLAKLQDDSISLDADVPFDRDGHHLTDFSPVTEEEVHKIIKQAAPKSCCLDPAPTKLVKECLDILVPLLTRIVNQSFAKGYFPKAFKLAAVTPLLKKADLIPEILSNFRPISNLPFLSKILEKVATKQLLQHKEVNKLREKMQSAYRKHHSTETALLRINHDLLMAMDRRECVLMAMLDLSAAFDTVHHKTLLDRLSVRYGITGNAYAWIKSYLTDRKQFVSIQGHRSEERLKDCDVPQGSVLGPNLYEDYTAPPLGDIFRKHDIQFHIYADDTQAYLAFSPGKEESALYQLEACLQEVKSWMAANWLKLNNSKTEFIVFGAKKYLSLLSITSLTLGESIVPVRDCVKSIGANFDCNLKMEKQISSTCRAAWFYLYQIGKIRKYLNEKQTKSVIHAHVTSRLDQNNSLLVGLPKKSLSRLQSVQNAAARLIVGLKKKDHVTPTLIKLHWLPIEYRILFKVLLLTYKSLHGKGPEYLSDLLTPYVPSRSLRSAADNKLCVPKSNYVATQKRAFGIRAPTEWNKLPAHLRSEDSMDSFKKALKTHLFVKAYD